MRRIWVRKANSFKEVEKFDIQYYQKMSPTERLETVQLLREQYFKLNPKLRNERRKGLRKVIKITRPDWAKEKVNFIGRGELARNKRIVNREQDQADLKVLLRTQLKSKG